MLLRCRRYTSSIYLDAIDGIVDDCRARYVFILPSKTAFFSQVRQAIGYYYLPFSASRRVNAARWLLAILWHYRMVDTIFATSMIMIRHASTEKRYVVISLKIANAYAMCR